MSKKSTITHIATLHAAMDRVIAGLETDQFKVAVAKEITNAAGKRINAFRTQLEYYKLRKQKPTIAALK
jgi:hypothetical protein